MSAKAFPGARLLPVLNELQRVQPASIAQLQARLSSWPEVAVRRAVENAAARRYVEPCGFEGGRRFLWRLTALGSFRLGTMTTEPRE